MLSYLSFKAEDWGCMTQLFFDNASTLLGVLIAVYNMEFFGVPVSIIDEVSACFPQYPVSAQTGGGEVIGMVG